MSTTIPTLSISERTADLSSVFKSVAKRIAGTIRCGLPGIITAFDATTQYCHVRLAIKEHLINLARGGHVVTDIPELEDVLLILPGDANYCLTFPNIVGSECYVCFADMCVNQWATYGMTKRNGKYYGRKQQIQRRHNLSDGFAILAPRSQPNKIPNYSTTAVELRSMDGSAKISLTNAGTVLLKGNGLEIDGTGGIIVKPGTTPSNACIGVIINGVQYYIRLSTTP